MTACSLMTWNVENLFPPQTPSGPGTRPIYQRKLAYLAKTITRVAPDVVALQEIGDPSCLDDLQTALAGAYPHAAISRHPDRRGIRVAILSARPLVDIRQLSAFSTDALPSIPTPDGQRVKSMGRGALHAVAELADGRPLRVVTAHLKSKLLSYPDGRRFPKDEHERARGAGFALLRRTGEAVALRVWLNALLAGNDVPTLLAGDLNDGPEAITTQLLSGPPDASADRRDAGDDVRLNNLADWLPAKHQYTRMFRGDGELIDHILVSQDLLRSLRQVDSLVHDIRSITEDVESRKDARIPDHAPVFARFELT